MSDSTITAGVIASIDVRQQRGLDQLRSALGDIVRVLNDSLTEDVSVNEDGLIWLKKSGAGATECGPTSDIQRRAIINAVASINGTVVNADHPILETTLPPEIGDCRFTGLVPPVVSAPCFTIRTRPRRIYTLADYIDAGILSGVQALILTSAIRKRENILNVGATGSGKTTLLNAQLERIAKLCPEDRIVTIEDTMELQCASPDKVQLQAAGDVTMAQCLRAALRLNPTRIIVGEVRGPEALDLLKAWNTGHPGGISTIHADSAIAGLYRLEECCMEATAAPQHERIARTINVAVFIEATPEGRRVQEIIRVTGYRNGQYQTEAL